MICHSFLKEKALEVCLTTEMSESDDYLVFLITEFCFKVNPELIDEEGKDSGLYS